ncbi:efflux RND transporter periplasmic adaptor subunit [Cupriavidus basilensis]|uniref:Efflux RND transporter periplasmic adaptor subunit n=1 Tax=Cupriavidus basilensis TaxID=68895 RepID=A0ABT6AW32_9BURK|nr:efflux RND transporter periplasmic adaptor subunit [Cupriavidus basilensis]MDF3836778.1 efflux RND transporter periplasmic adaptor subunit [Cupriavidus basilensis]
MNKNLMIGAGFVVVLAGGIWGGKYWAQAQQAQQPQQAQPAGIPLAKAPAAKPRRVPSRLTLPEGGFDPNAVKSAVFNMQTVAVDMPTPGKLAYNVQQAKLASARVAGRVEHILVYEGAVVRPGQPLAELYSPEYIAAQNEYLLSHNAYHTLSGSGLKELVDDARLTMQSSENKLRVLGATPEDIARIRERGTASDTLTLRAPIGGTIVKRDMDPGSYLNVGDSLMSIIDTRSIWFTGNLYENDIRNVRLGQTIEIETPAYPGRRYRGRVSFIAPNVDADTHTLQVRCDVPNPDGTLKPEMYATARIVTGTAQALVVPQSAIVKDQGKLYLMTQPDDKHIERVAVQGTPRSDGTFQVTEGAPAGAPVRVVTQGGMLLNEMLLKQEA